MGSGQWIGSRRHFAGTEDLLVEDPYIGTQVTPPLILLFALQYTGQGRKIAPLTTGLLFVIPAFIVFLAATNDIHGLVWVNFLPGPPGTNSLIYQHGPAF